MSPDARYVNRKSHRYPGYDYASAGAYFVTVCTKDRLPVLDNDIVCNIVTDIWHALPEWFPTIALDEFVVMPNHVHFVVWLGIENNPPERRQGTAAPMHVDRQREYKLPVCRKPRMAPSLGDVVGSWKSLVFATYQPWVEANMPALRAKFWQRNYYDHIIRSEQGLQVIRDYIRANPARWMNDPDNPDNSLNLLPPDSVGNYLDDVQRFHRQMRRPT